MLKKGKANIVFRAIKPVNLTLIVEEDRDLEVSVDEPISEASVYKENETEIPVPLEEQEIVAIDEKVIYK